MYSRFLQEGQQHSIVVVGKCSYTACSKHRVLLRLCHSSKCSSPAAALLSGLDWLWLLHDLHLSNVAKSCVAWQFLLCQNFKWLRLSSLPLWIVVQSICVICEFNKLFNTEDTSVPEFSSLKTYRRLLPTASSLSPHSLRGICLVLLLKVRTLLLHFSSPRRPLSSILLKYFVTSHSYLKLPCSYLVGQCSRTQGECLGPCFRGAQGLPSLVLEQDPLNSVWLETR